LNVDKRTPVVTLLLIAANIAAAFLLVWQPELVDRYGFVAASPQVFPAITCLFLHANLFHLLGNMVFLAAAGPATEAAVGSIRFFGVYLASGLLGVAAHWALSPNKEAPLIGASGAVTGCVALGAVRFYRSKVPLAPSLSAPLFSIVVFWLLLQVVGGFVHIGEEAAGTSYWSHVGGAMAGFTLALAFKAPAEADRRESQRMIAQMSERGPAAVLAAADRHLAQHPRDEGALLQKAEALAKLGDRARAATLYIEVLDRASSARQAEVLDLVSASGCLEDIPSMKRTLYAEQLKSRKQDLAAVLLESVVKGPPSDSQRPDAILALAEIRRDSDPDGANRLVAELFAQYPLHPASEIARAKGWSA
jgi:membrane associated rhomboid family serine protease